MSDDPKAQIAKLEKEVLELKQAVEALKAATPGYERHAIEQANARTRTDAAAKRRYMINLILGGYNGPNDGRRAYLDANIGELAPITDADVEAHHL